MAILMDGVSYNVRITFPSLSRSFNIPQGSNKGKNLAYEDIDDIFGTEYGYSFTVEADPADVDAYDSFYEAVSAPVGFHTVTMPYGQSTITFQAKVTSGSDTFRGTFASKKRWGPLTVRFVPFKPQRTV